MKQVAGTVSSTQHQLMRGGIPLGSLKQKQLVFIQASEILASLWRGMRGFLDKVSTPEIFRLEALWLDHIRSAQSNGTGLNAGWTSEPAGATRAAQWVSVASSA